MQPGALEVDPFASEPPLSWPVLFGRDRPVELEIGCGKGLFLCEVARNHPERDFLGVERAGKYYRRAAAALARAGLANVRLLRADGLDVLARWITPGSITVLHILFPDPWPKRRHQKRRIFRPEMLALARRALVAGGELRVATDHAQYGEAIRRLLAEHLHLFSPLPWPTEEGEHPPTNYALKWERLGRTLWWARYRALGGD